MRLQIGRYARLRGVYHNTIEHAVRTGVIPVGADGLIDSDEADATWWVAYRARLEAKAHGDQANSTALQVQLAARLTKIQLTRVRYETRERDYTERNDVRQSGVGCVAGVRKRITATARSATFETGEIENLPEEMAPPLIAEFFALVTGELGDLDNETSQAVEGL